MASSALTFNIYGNDVTGSKALRKVGKEGENTANRVGMAFKRLAVGGGLAAAGGLLAALRTGLVEAQDAAKGNAQLVAGIESTGNAANVTVKGMNALASEIQSYSGQTDDSITATQSLLLTFTNIKNVGADKIFDDTTKAAADMAARLGGDASDSAIQLGKALNDPIKGVTALTRVGVSFTDAQKKQIKAMVESGDTIGAQKLILAELNKEFGGSAKAAGDTLPGQIQKMKRAFEDASQSATEALLPALTATTRWITESLIPAVSGVVDWMRNHATIVKTLAVVLGGLATVWAAVTVAAKAQGVATQFAARLTDLHILKMKESTAVAAGNSGALAKVGSAAGKMAGPLGVAGAAIGLVAVAWTQHRAAQQAAQERVESMTEALKADNGALGENSRALAANNLNKTFQYSKNKSAYEVALRAGVGQKLLTDAYLGNSDAVKQVTTALEDYIKTTDDKAGVAALYATVKAGAEATEKAAVAQANYAAGADTAARASDGASESQRKLGLSADETTRKMQEEGDKAGLLSAALDKLNGAAISGAQAELRFRSTLDSVTDAAQQNGRAVDLNTQAGRKNYEAVLGAIVAAQDHAKAVQEVTGSIPAATAALRTDEQAIRLAAAAAGLNAQQVDAMIKKYGQVPANVKTTAELKTDAAIRSAETYKRVLSGIGGNVQLFGIPAYAGGTNFHPGGDAIVGEKGPEILRLPRGSQVIPNNQIPRSSPRAMAPASPTVVYVTVQGSVIREKEIGEIALSVIDGKRFNRGGKSVLAV